MVICFGCEFRRILRLRFCGKLRRRKGSKSATCGHNGALWRKSFSMPWRGPDADYRSRISALVGRSIGPGLALVGDHAAGCENGAAGEMGAADNFGCLVAGNRTGVRSVHVG